MNLAAKPTSEAEFRPRYARIQQILEDRVASGVYPVGSLLPTEIELSREFETSRFTIREALRKLHEHGYVERRQGVGTRVVNASPKASFSLSVNSLEQLFQVAVDTWFVILSIEHITLDAETADLVDGTAGEPWILISGMRWTEPGGRPICYVQSFIPGRFEPLIPALRTHQGPMFNLLERNSDWPILKVVQEITARRMPDAVASLLGQRTDSWALRLLRRYVTEQEVIIASLNWHPSDQMAYMMEIHRQNPTAD